MIKRKNIKVINVEKCPRYNEGEQLNCLTCFEFIGIANQSEIKCNYDNQS